LRAGDNILEGDNLVDEATMDVFALFWKTIALLAVKAFGNSSGTEHYFSNIIGRHSA